MEVGVVFHERGTKVSWVSLWGSLSPVARDLAPQETHYHAPRTEENKTFLPEQTVLMK